MQVFFQDRKGHQSMEILHVPSAHALLRTLSFISQLDLTMDPPTRGGMLRRWYWEEVKAMNAPYVGKFPTFVTQI
jgi:hypothetical protein